MSKRRGTKSRSRGRKRSDGIHTSHQLTKWTTEVRAPAGTERTYKVRYCSRCGFEQLLGVGGGSIGSLGEPCPVQP